MSQFIDIVVTSAQQFLTATAGSPRESPVVAKLKGFAKLPPGWDMATGLSVTATAIKVAESLLNLADQLQLKADVFPGSRGDCSVTFYAGQKSVEVIVGPDHPDRFSIIAEEGVGFDFKRVLDVDDAGRAEVLHQLTSRLLPTPASFHRNATQWSSSGSFHYFDTTQRSNVSLTLSSEGPVAPVKS